jgi:outer membrane protein TolC
MTSDALDPFPAVRPQGWREVGATFAVLMAALLTSACATLPAATPARVAKAPDAYAATQTLSAPETAWPADAWWTSYGDAQLNGLIDEALKGSPTLAAAQARLRRAQSLVGQAKAAELPRSSSAPMARREPSRATTPAFPPAFVPHGYNDYGRLAWTSAGSWTSGARTARPSPPPTSEAKAAQADAAQARLTLSTSTASPMPTLGRLYAQRDVAAQAVALRQETSDLVPSG